MVFFVKLIHRPTIYPIALYREAACFLFSGKNISECNTERDLTCPIKKGFAVVFNNFWQLLCDFFYRSTSLLSRLFSAMFLVVDVNSENNRFTEDSGSKYENLTALRQSVFR